MGRLFFLDQEYRRQLEYKKARIFCELLNLNGDF